VHEPLKIAIGADHGGFLLKAELVKYLEQTDYAVVDLGTFSDEAVDYPDYARAVAQAMRGAAADRGILICGSGVGACVAANKFPGVRAAVCHDTFSARQGVEDDDMNILCLGARVIGAELAIELVRTFLSARFSGAERHVKRLGKVVAIEKQYMKECKEGGPSVKIGYIGLGKMGFNMVERLLEKGHEVVAYDRNADTMKAARNKGAQTEDTLSALVAVLPSPRLVWIMVPHQAVDAVLKDLTPHLAKGDVVIDGGNSPYKESIRRAAELGAKGIDFLDAGVSGGPAGARSGACIMVGGEKTVFQKFEALFRDLSVPDGYGYMGKSGAGHFVKMVHNGIEYGMMEALAEGFAVLRASPFKLNLGNIAELYNHKSVIESRLVEWLGQAYELYGEDLSDVSGSAAQSGEGAWTIEAGKEFGVPMPIIQGALDFRLQSLNKPSYTGRLISALRHQFGGHEVKAKK
jgi:6-phosphogluconate dehydrogenase